MVKSLAGASGLRHACEVEQTSQAKGTSGAKRTHRLGFDRATLTLGHEVFVGVATTAGFFSRQRVNFSGTRSGRDRVSFAADLAFNSQLWGLPAGGVGYIVGTDHKLNGAYVNAGWGPIGTLHHPDYGHCVGVFLPGLGGLLVGREVIAFGCTVARFTPLIREGGYVFLRHPAIAILTSPAFALGRWVAGVPLVDRRVGRPVTRGVRFFKRKLEPLRRAEDKLFRRVAETLDGRAKHGDPIDG